MGWLDWIAPALEWASVPFTYGATLPLAIGGTATAAGKSIQQAGQPSPIQAAGSAISSATQAAGQNRLNQEELALKASQDNVSGQTAYERELMDRAALEEKQRGGALRDTYRAGAAYQTSPFNPRGTPSYSPEYTSALKNLASQGATKLATGAQYDTSKLSPLAAYKPLDIKNLQAETNTQASTLEKIGQIAGPTLSVVGAISKMLGRQVQSTDELTQDDWNFLNNVTSGEDTTIPGDMGDPSLDYSMEQ